MLTLRHPSSASLFLAASFILSLTLLPTQPSYAQTSASTSHVAYVYVGTTKGVYLYDAASNGSLTPVSGSPFSVAGLAIGSNGKYFVSVGTDYVHSYPVASNGAIKPQVSQINTQSYSGSTCGTTSGSVLDHTGQDVYVQLNFAQNTECTALQSFKISSSGALTFLGATEFNQTLASEPTLIALTGSGALGYSFAGEGFCSTATYEFQRESSGAMMFGTTMYLTTPPPSGDLQPLVGTADPTNHLAIAGTEEPDYCTFEPAQLASYTVASNGDITSTNTTQNMPTPQVNPTVLNMSPSGKFLALGGNTASWIANSTQHPGLEVFHFNGANPITSYSGVLTTTPIDEIHWDSSNHLYALSNSTKKLYVYTVTSSSITAAPGSPFTIAATPNALTVVPTLSPCSAPSSAGVHICAPASGSTVSSPVQVQAAATVTGTISNMQLWVDGVKKYAESGSKTLNTSVSVATGTHRFAVLALNTAGQKWESAVNATVK
jgi:hypothetical protein